jgi:hypothetical protein
MGTYPQYLLSYPQVHEQARALSAVIHLAGGMIIYVLGEVD